MTSDSLVLTKDHLAQDDDFKTTGYKHQMMGFALILG
jgi:hypothetical protein